MLDLPSIFLNRLDKVIANNLADEDFSIEFLCKELTISYTHTYRKIRQVTGLSPSMYVCRKCLEAACQLLTSTKMSIEEIAFRVGFNTQAYFSKFFSEVYDCTPLRFRKQFGMDDNISVLALS
ncbi:MAG: helix-turn-helix domain-containing protein [Saprospiraceae bacterium]